ncbi:MAG: hypothetical protein RSD12_07420 [Akkermansia sp.]
MILSRLPILLLSIGLFLLSACHSTYTPNKSEVYGKTIPDDNQQVELARQAWEILSDNDQKNQWPSATLQYNKAVRIIFLRTRYEKYKTNNQLDFAKVRPYDIQRYNSKGTRDHNRYKDAIPCDLIDTTFRLEERVFVKGLGLPVAGVVKTDTNRSDKKVLKDSGNVNTLTAILDFGSTTNKKPILRIIPRLDTETIKIGNIDHPLAADFSAPLAHFWEKNTALTDTALLGVFRPKETADFTGLYFSEPYNPNKIPVLLTHGLMSSPDTFCNLVNRLIVDPEIRHHYQFWYFSYPSGVPWVISAKEQRDALNAIIHEYDPHGTSPTLNNIVMVGHSMGGLITRYNNASRPWGIIPQLMKNQDAIAKMNYTQAEKVQFGNNPVASKKIANTFIFNPYKQTSRIVFMSTPHQGSPIAESWIGFIGMKLIRLPENIITEATRIATLSRSMLLLNPKTLERSFTSIYQLSPNAPLIKGLQPLRPDKKIPVHSIIGNNGGWNHIFSSSDGVVPYSSSHLDWSQSEDIVHSGHSVQDTIPAALALRKILHEHLNQLKISDPQHNCPPTIWQTNPPPRIVLPGYVGR